jgi:hypothetical protein
MTTLEQYQTPPSWLAVLGEGEITMPEWITEELTMLKMKLRQVLSQDYEYLELALESLLPKVWELRMRVLPILNQLDLTEALKKVEAEFALIPQRMPSVAAAAEKLNYGLHLMDKWVKTLMSQNTNLLQDLQQQLPDASPSSFEELIAQLAHGENQTIQKLLHGSLMMELLLFTIDLAADEQIPLDFGVCYELGYQSAVAVEEYASALGHTAEQMPWYSPPQNDLQRLLLEGPVLSEPDIQYITEKRKHLNSWK